MYEMSAFPVLYHKVGGDLVLKPEKSTVPDHITSILWKHGKNKVAEWDKDFGGLDVYAAFKERTTLDQTTGELRISGLMKTDSGVYSMEFNRKLLDKTYTLSVINVVPKPKITSFCNPDKTSCILTCEGDTTDAEPVTYSWKVGEGPWEVLDKQLFVSKSNTGKSNSRYNYICKLKNAVSGEVSEPVGEVFGPVLYHKVGGDLVLKPEKSTVPDPITSILWKHGKNKVAEWDKDFGGLDIYGAFRERTTLDQTTGELRISGLMKTDSGVYSTEFNRKLLDKTYTLSVIKAVPKPTITSSCNPDKTSCTLTCEVDTTDAEPVTYSWEEGERLWEVLDKQLFVSKSNTGKSNSGYNYICKLKNAVSGEVSEPVGEVFGPEYLYHKVGGKLVLTPDKSTVTDPITSILWKHGKYKVAEWDKDFGGLDVYAAFKERTTLDQTTGELRISGLMKTDSGVYSVEFNSKLLDKTYTLSVIKAVPKPTITSSCNPDKTSCTLTCEGDTTDAESVTYSWKVGEGPWEVLDKQLFVSKSNTGKSNSRYNYICKLKNAVSGEVSEPVGEVFGSVLYHKVGGDLVLKPEKSTVPDPITSILWKHGKNKVAEWDKDFGGLDIYGAFRERTTLDQTTGELRISGLMKTDSGVYSTEFNRKLLDKTYTLSVIKAVPKPTITSSCNPDKTSCTLTCEVDTTDAEPVTYSWEEGERLWEVLDKQLFVSKSNTGKSNSGYNYICKLKNAVSGEVSEPVGEVFGPEYLYHKVGGKLVLTPDKSTVTDPITSILWKHGKYKVAEWDKDFGGLDIYGAFRERTTLDQTTGELRISGLMKTDSGVYSVEFNSKLLDKTYTLSVIKAVPKPTITSSCNPDKTSCILTCEGDTTDAEPVTYSWKVGEGPWEVLDKQLFVSKSNTGKSNSGYNYICKLKNAVSGEVSEPVGEVFGPVLYHKVGGDLVLKPEKSTVPDPITSILWKHGKNKVAEWDKDFGGLDIYGAFRERTTLDQTTGELRISGLMKTDSGVYSTEFNRKLLDKTYTLSVINVVPKPTITSSCNPDKTSCILTCEGDTTDAEPVTYSWKVGEGPWEVLDKQLFVSKSNTGKSNSGYNYICKLKNAVSGEVSEPVGEVFGSEYLYHKVGGKLVLTPDKSTVTDPITSILWKHGKYKVAEWDKDFGGLDIYGAFRERTTLDQTTGELRISGLMKTDSGVYSVEFNSKLLDKTYTLSVIKAVPKPTITSSCNPDKTSCTLTCEGDTTDAEPVTYSWKVGEGPWEVLDKQHNVCKSNTGKSTNSYKYICKLNNAVSGEGEVSEPVGEVFGPEGNHEEELGVGKGEADEAAEKT
ncbi:obscurin-like isoform X2 [Oncorhynchus clarkii lewisi]|uniref:obscurin-like isoform X2 n=1 Tax=Oncorhynchus clarkii lewisi TaxID=490388 RepID=UPI0039B9A2D3